MLALLLFVLQPLLHAHPLGALPNDHRAGLHAPGADFAKAAVGETHPSPDPVVVAEANRLDEPALPTGAACPPRPDAGATPAFAAPAWGISSRPPRRATSPRGPPH